VDFSEPIQGRKSASGFLNALPPSTLDDSLVIPLKPQVWRLGDEDAYKRVKSFGAEYMFVVSEAWRYPWDKWPNGQPWKDWLKFETLVSDLANRSPGRPVLLGRLERA
jgi:hypothetical protein